MAPDINTVGQSSGSTRSQATPRSPTSPHRVRPASLALSSRTPSSQETSTLPVRHSRPMTPAELHLELEKEQEAVVNRLTRELSALRAQTASVASNNSSSSAATASSNIAVFDSSEPSSAHTNPLTGASHPTTSRHHRSSSSLSSRSRSSTIATATTSAVPIGSTSQASVDRARDAVGMSAPAGTRSRGSSSVPLPQNLSAHPSPSLANASPSEFFGVPHSSAGSTSGMPMQHASRPHASSASSLSSARLEEAAKARDALQEARTENEQLIRKAKELERRLTGLQTREETNDQERGRGRTDSRDGQA